MDLAVFFAVLAAAAMHAAWNAFIKGGGDPFIVVAQMGLCALLLSSVLIFFVKVPEPAAWPWLAASAVLHTGYRLALVGAYRAGDLGQVYPIARGTAPLITAVMTATLIDEVLASTAYLGIIVLAIGVFLISLRGGPMGGFERRAVGFALQTSLWISAYSFVDGYGARVNGSGPSYVIWMFLVNAALNVSFALIVKGAAITSGLRHRWPTLLGATAISQGAYFIAIWAMTKAPIALVAALRETSVLFAALISVLLLGEPMTRWRIAAAAIIVTGVILLRLS